MKKLVWVVLSLVMFNCYADGLTVVAVGDAQEEVDKVIFSYHKNVTSEGKSIIKVIANDFGFYQRFFKVLPFSLQDKSQVDNADIWVHFTQHAENLKVELENRRNSLKWQKEFSISKKWQRRDAHKIADAIYQILRKKKSIFLSKIFFVSDRGSSRKRPVKELYQIDFDGYNAKRLTFHHGLVISPAVNLAGDKVLYSLISYTKNRRKRNINLRLLDLKTMKSRLISSRPGINSGAVFTHDDNKIILTLSDVGNAEIFEMDLRTKRLRRITKHFAQDVDPSIRADGQRMAFLSSRSGKGAMIYTLDPRGMEKGVRRISYVGKFNATPRFSPEGTEIAFSSWLDNCFDIFRIGVDGNNLVRLTKDFGSNEDPTYSPDGEFIAFSSQRVLSRRKISQKIYIMDRDGTILGAITNKLGNCITPRWSN